MNTLKNNQVDATTQTGGMEGMKKTIQAEEVKEILSDLDVTLARTRGFSTMIANVLDLSGKMIPRYEGEQAQKEFNDLSNLLYYMEKALPEQIEYIYDRVQELDRMLIDYDLNE